MSDADVVARLAALEATCAALQVTCDELRAQLEEVTSYAVPTMKDQRECPACGATRLAHATKVADQNGTARPGELALSIKFGWSGITHIGPLEAFACTSCGLVELHVKGPGELREVAGELAIIDEE